jgi:hypothetical protein
MAGIKGNKIAVPLLHQGRVVATIPLDENDIRMDFITTKNRTPDYRDPVGSGMVFLSGVTQYNQITTTIK